MQPSGLPPIYSDAGHQAIGWGHDVTPSDPDYSAGITQEEADKILIQDLSTLQDEVNSYDLPLSQNQYGLKTKTVFYLAGPVCTASLFRLHSIQPPP
jgi:GH24 family phage-related lysozyme (muramidase)